jgi:hypothetical protein
MVGDTRQGKDVKLLLCGRTMVDGMKYGGKKSIKHSEDLPWLLVLAATNCRRYRLNPARYQWATWPSEGGVST